MLTWISTVPALSAFVGASAGLLTAWVGMRRFSAESRANRNLILSKQSEITEQGKVQLGMLSDIQVSVDGKLSLLLEAMAAKAEMEIKLARLTSFREGAEEQQEVARKQIDEYDRKIHTLQMRQERLESDLSHKARI